MSIMPLGDFQAEIDYDADLQLYRGEILGLSGGADFYGSDTDQLMTEFKKSLAAYLEVCEQNGIAPLPLSPAPAATPI